MTDGRRNPPAKSTATVGSEHLREIMLPAGTKMRLLSQQTRHLSDLQFKLLFILFNEVDRATAVTIISHRELAAKAGCGERAVEQNITRLCQLGCIEADRNEVGRRQNGRPIFGGRGHRNRYRLAGARRAEGPAFDPQRPSADTVLKDRPTEIQRPNETTRNTVLNGTSPYTLESSHKESLRNEETGGSSNIERCLGGAAWRAVKEKLGLSHRQRGGRCVVS